MAYPLPARYRTATVALTLASALALPATALAQPQRNGPLPTPLPLFPPDNWWNVDISAAPVDSNSANFISFIGTTVGLFPGDADATNTSTINFSAGVTRANNAIVPLASSGSGALSLQSSTPGVHVVLDVMGYFL